MSQEKPNEHVSDLGREEELAPELKAIEAELAALSPREDRLDRERLVFLAGRASVGGRFAGRGPFVAAWAWPASTAGMTAVAATLLVVLLLRPEPPVVEQIRFVEVPVEMRADDAEHPAGDAGEKRDAPLAPRRFASQPDAATGTLASSPAGGRPGSAWEASRTRAMSLEMVDRILSAGADPWARPLPVSTGEDRHAEGPAPYRQRLKSLLDDQARAEPPSDWPNAPLNSGMNS
ncbi:MAG: hypothetical protein ABIP48_33540 [Planctomycetota bacterium]